MDFVLSSASVGLEFCGLFSVDSTGTASLNIQDYDGNVYGNLASIFVSSITTNYFVADVLHSTNNV